MRLTPRGEFVLINVMALSLFFGIQLTAKEPSAQADERPETRLLKIQKIMLVFL
jgi:hypothetical protein